MSNAFNFDKIQKTENFIVKINSKACYGFFEHDKLGDECGGGLWFEGKNLMDYDGVPDLPKEVRQAIVTLGYRFDEDEVESSQITDYQKHLFQILGEEGSEISQACSKIIRFTPFHQAPGYENTNIQNLTIEVNDVFAVLDLLSQEGFTIQRDEALINSKKERIAKYFKISQELGTYK